MESTANGRALTAFCMDSTAIYRNDVPQAGSSAANARAVSSFGVHIAAIDSNIVSFAMKRIAVTASAAEAAFGSMRDTNTYTV